MTDKRLKEIISSMTIIVDVAEQSYLHITDYLDKQGIKWIRQNLDFGDYSFIIDGKSYEKKFSIERKSSLNEISGNYSNGRERFKKEFDRATESNAKMIIMIEQVVPKEFPAVYKKILHASDKNNKPLLTPDEIEILNKCISGVGSYKDIINHNYDTDMTPKSLEASLLAWNLRYDVSTWFVPKKLSGQFIFDICESFLKNELKQLEAV